MKNELITKEGRLPGSGSEKTERLLRTPIEVALQIDPDGFTTARKLYDWLELDEGNYSRWVKANILENPFAEEGAEYSSLMKKIKPAGAGRPTTDYKISASFAKKLAMASKSERGEQARIYFLMCERTLAQVAVERQKTLLERERGKAARRSLTDVIIQSGENERMKGHGISTYTDLAYRAALGAGSKQLKAQKGLGKHDNLRNNLTVDELAAVRKVENVISSLVEIGMDYNGVHRLLKERTAGADQTMCEEHPA